MRYFIIKSLLEIFNKSFRCILMKASVTYHDWHVRNYWSETNITHGSMDDQEFNFYAGEIQGLLGDVSNKSVCDYGGGNGELAIRLKKKNCSIEVAEFTDNFKKEILGKGLTFVDADSLPLDCYDILIANNCLFYVHPRKLKSEIERLLKSLKKGGELWITDVPDYEKINFLTSSFFKILFYKLTGIYQIEQGGFFVKFNMLRSFNSTKSDSWCVYRSHFRILN